MRRPGLLLFVAMGCTFDGSGFGAPPASSADTTATGPGPGESSGVVEPTTTTTIGMSGSGSISGSSGSSEVTSEPGTATAATTTTVGETTDGTTAAETTTTSEPGTSTTEPCETMMVFVDADGDTFGDPGKPAEVCLGQWEGFANNGDDCNDMAANAHPGQPEVCDGLDNDCDMTVDEYDATSNKDECEGCKFRVREQRLYYFCAPGMNWDASRAFCTARKLDLAIDSDTAENDWLEGRLDEFSGDNELWWLGGRESGGKFKWVDGTEVPGGDARWALNQPDNWSLDVSWGADCLGLRAPWIRQWWDDDCGEGRKFVCEGPLP